MPLEHTQSHPSQPTRVVVLGAGGFVGRTAADAFATDGTPVLGLGRNDVDLIADRADTVLAEQLRDTDTLIVISAEAPCKDGAMLERNIRMMRSVTGALTQVQPAHVVYVSSDAVYADSAAPLTEASCAEPGSLHGVMHLARELMLKEATKGPLAILRPTLIYGAADPHNGYGPNRFRRLAAAGEDILLFGEGEERRDHVDVRDVAELIRLIAAHRSSGVLNAVTGTVTSFREIAELVVALSETEVGIKGSPRQGPMPHNGYRAFDPSDTLAAFPEFRYTPLADGLAHAQNEMAETL
ncbi:NAD-dependent epimerase/dehydratase family protein [bacterium SCSIO 12827]|nr:NAD-dependent epimerase/dehydratase family protein [bacterium SCSIO 12827]